MKKSIILSMILVIFTGITLGQVPHLINYQGVLIDSETGQPVTDETYSIDFSIYDVPTGGSAGWIETHSVETKNGFYSVQLGLNTPLTPTDLSGPEKYLGIKVGEDPEMTPRKRIVSVAYAFIAESVSGTSNTFPSDGNVGIGTTSPAGKLEVAGTIHSTTGGIKFPDGTTQTTAASGGGGGWTDGGTNVYLTTSTDKVGIGDTSPTHKLDVAGKIGINDTQVLFLPEQGNFTGTLILGNGGGSLSHASGNDGCYNTAIGMRALNSNTTGYMNTASGVSALYSNTTGIHNTCSGYGALYANTAGSYNTASGYGALAANTTGGNNTASGYAALAANTTGGNNTAIGFQANYFNRTGSNNTIIGYQAGNGTAEHDKSGNIFIGYQAGYNETGSNKLYIENSNSTSPLIGGDFSTDELYLNGNVGIGTSSPGAELDVAGKIKTSQLQVGTSTTAGYVLTSDAGGNATWQAAAGGGGGWTDGGTNVYLTTSTDKVGIGDSSPTHKLDVTGKIGINDTQVLYLPDQIDFTGTLILGDGGGSLSHSSGDDGRYNTAIGINALNANTTGKENTASGCRALYSNTTGYSNTASGFGALSSNTTGFRNTAIGFRALSSNTIGIHNTANGYYALFFNTSGHSNTASGNRALYSNTTGFRTTAIGYGALSSNTTGNYNIGIGYESNYYNQEGSNNTIIGYQAGHGTAEHDKSGNILIGFQAGYNEIGDNKLYIENSNSDSPLIGGDFSTDELYLNANVGIGTSSPNAELDVAGKIKTSQLRVGTSTTAGYVLTADASGNATWQAGGGGGGGWTDGGTNVYLTTSTDKVGIGDTSPTHKLDVAGKIGINDTQMLYLPDQNDFEGTLYLGDGGGSLSHSSGDDGHHNTAIGMGTLNANTTGYSNTASGYGALYSNTTGYMNTASGYYALYANTSGGYNTASGYLALSNNTTGYSNTANGYGALNNNTTGYSNTVIGEFALKSNTTGNSNVGIGCGANYYNREGSNNTIIGYQAGYGTSAHDKSGNVFIGYQAGYNETGDNKLYIENSNSNSPLIGGDFSTDELYLNGNVGIGTSSPAVELDVAGKIKTSELQVGTSTTAGYVLTADASGNATWQAGGGGGGGWTDGGTNVYLTTSSDKVGIGDSSPTHKLDVAGKIGINDTQVLFLPDQTNFTGTLYLGDGGGSLIHYDSEDGRYNTAIGIGALNANTYGACNSASGYQVLYSNTGGGSNTATGYKALYSNTSGHSNTASGSRALYSNISGVHNTASGDGALYFNTFGSFNTVSGCEALYSNTSGNSNTASGYQALYHNTTGHHNTAIGHWALYSNTSGHSNTASGSRALYSNISGVHNTASGIGALYSNTTGNDNTANGYEALCSNEGDYNTASGYYALHDNTSGYSNTASGYNTLFSNTTGHNNTAVGAGALSDNTTGSINTASGDAALYKNITGSYNTASGYGALFFNESGDYNTASGNGALQSNTEGNYNSALGCYADVISGILENSTAIGYNAKVNASNKVVIGNTSVTVIGGYAQWSNLSDGRFKRELREDIKGLDFITRLRPVSYKLDIPALNTHLGVKSKAEHGYVSNSNKGDIVYSGFIGQEVEAAAREAGYDFSGVVPPQNEKDHYSLRYAEFVVPLVKAVQEQQKMIEDLQNEVAALKKRLGE